MASVSVSHLIIFVASLVVAAGVVGTLTTGVERVNSAVEDGSLDVSQQVRTDITIVNDPGATYTTGEELTVYVRNTGSQGIPIQSSAVDIVFNGNYIPNSNTTISDANGDADVWRPNGVVEITITSPLIEPDDNRLFLTVNGDEEVFEFRGSSS